MERLAQRLVLVDPERVRDTEPRGQGVFRRLFDHLRTLARAEPGVCGLRLYVERFLPALARPGNDHLFPGRSGGAIDCSSLARQITAVIRRATGCRVNPHLFRHLGAKRHLDAHPGEYGVVQRVMGHKSADTTSNVYCGLESAAAARHFDAGLLERRRVAEQRLGHRPRRR